MKSGIFFKANVRFFDRIVFMQPEFIGRYRVITQIGTGAMASIYRARDKNLGRDVALKILHTHLTEKKEHIQRFIREAHALANLPHPNIVQIYDFGADGDLYYIVSEFVDGKDLSQILSIIDPLPVPVATIVVLQLLEAIDYAHKHGIIHRDIKLENVMLGSDGIVKLTDFGIAHIFEWDKMTLPGALIGSPYYMAPEIIEGKSAKSASDIFSAGVLFYRLVTGHFPFPGSNPAQVLRSILKDEPRPPHKLFQQVDRELSRHILDCMDKNPDGRPDAGKLKDELLRYLEPLSIRDGAHELRDFYLKPEEYWKFKNAQFIQSLTENARKFLSVKEYGSAIALLNRAISSGAVSKEVTRLLNTAKFNKRLWLYPVILLTSVIILIGGIRLLERKGENIKAPLSSVVIKTEEREQWLEEKKEGAEERKEKKKDRKEIVKKETKVVASKEKLEIPIEKPGIKTGRLTVRTNPWADVYIDDRFYGRTPFIDTIELPEGKHIIEVKNPFAEKVRKEIVIEEGRVYNEHLTLPLLPGSVDIIINVEAQLYIDGRWIGEGRNFEKIPLNQGRHTIKIEKKGYRPVERSIDVEAAQSLNLKIDLVKESIIWEN